MVGVFRRSFSFPNKTNSKPAISHHVRSISLPSRSHPQLFQLQDRIADLRAWSSHPPSPTSAWLSDGLDLLKTVLDHLDDFLNLDQTQESLRRHPHWVDKLLDRFLRFVDVYGTFRTLILALKEEHSAAQVAMRRKDEEKIAAYVKYRKRMARQLGKLVSTVQRQRIRISEQGGDAEMAVAVEEVVGVTVSVSLALFDGIARSMARRKTWRWKGLGVAWKKSGAEEKGIEELREIGVKEVRKKGKEEMKTAMKKMEESEDWIGGVEARSHRVFRSLITARVSLLNALSHPTPYKI